MTDNGIEYGFVNWLWYGCLLYHCFRIPCTDFALIWFSVHFKEISFPLCISKCICVYCFLVSVQIDRKSLLKTNNALFIHSQCEFRHSQTKRLAKKEELGNFSVFEMLRFKRVMEKLGEISNKSWIFVFHRFSVRGKGSKKRIEINKVLIEMPIIKHQM